MVLIVLPKYADRQTDVGILGGYEPFVLSSPSRSLHVVRTELDAPLISQIISIVYIALELRRSQVKKYL